MFTSHLVNQLVVGFNYFKQTFNSYDTQLQSCRDSGLNTGVTDPTLAGPPNITINGFAAVGGTQPLGRVDKTMHFTDNLNWSQGSHQVKFGGEARLAHLFVFYDSNKRGTFTYDGTVGPWASLPAAQASPALKALADLWRATSPPAASSTATRTTTTSRTRGTPGCRTPGRRRQR